MTYQVNVGESVQLDEKWTSTYIYLPTYLPTYLEWRRRWRRRSQKGGPIKTSELEDLAHKKDDLYIHTYIHTHIHIYIHTYIHTNVSIYLRTYLPTYQAFA